MVKLQGQNEIAHASQIYFVSLYRNLEFHFLSLFPNPDPQVKTYTHTHTHTHPILFQRYNATSMCACSVAKSCLTLWESVGCSLQGSSVHGILQARVLEWVAISTSKGSSHPGIEQESPASPNWQVHSLPLSHQGSPIMQHTILFIIADFFSWLQILQTEILVFSFLSWILLCSVDSEPFARLAQSQVSWTALIHLLDLLLHVNHSWVYCPFALQPRPTRGSQQSGIFFFSYPGLWIAVRFFICLFVLLGGLWMGDWGCIFHTKHCARYAVV